MKLRLVNKKQESGDIWSFFFEPTEALTWIAGQSIRLEIPRKTWGVSERRFTIASAPYEGHIRISTRIGVSDFKHDLAELEKGAEIQGFNIEGDFVWDTSTQHKLFLAAGIGITPFRSMLLEAAQLNTPLNTSLVYGTRDVPPLFLDEFTKLAQHDTSFTIFVTPDRIQIPSGDAWLRSLIYISGPEQMVADLAQRAITAGLPSEQLRTDLFTGTNL